MKTLLNTTSFIKDTRLNTVQPSNVNFHDAQNGWILTSILLSKLKRRIGG